MLLINTLSILLGTILLLSMPTGILASEEKDQVNSFYAELVNVLKKEDSNGPMLADLVRRDRRVAEQSLEALEKNLKKPGLPAMERESLKFLHGKLSEILLLTRPAGQCSEDIMRRLTEIVKRQVAKDERIFVLDNLVRICPKGGATYYLDLADLYLEERQFGMAIDAYKKSPNYKDNKDSKNLVEVAEKMLASYQKGGSVALADVRKLFREPTRTMAPVKGLRRKVEIRNAVQTNKILFPEWSAEIKKESVPLLDEVGTAVKEAFAKNEYSRLLIEGHADQRGDQEQNWDISRKRAEAIRDYLAGLGLDTSRLVTKGYGSSKPISPTDYDLNRRVEFKKTLKAEN